MRTEHFMELLAKEREKNVIKADKKNIAGKSSLNSIIYMGVTDEDLIKYVIPKIAAMEIAGEYSKENIKKWILANKSIVLLESPVRHSLEVSVDERRMDSLSRLLSLNVKYTPCVAVTFYKGELIVSSNSPSIISVKELEACMARKMGVVQDFLNELLKGVEFGSVPDVDHVEFTIRARLLATKAVLKLMADNGVGDVVPKNKDSRHKNRQTETEHLKNALLKIGEHCLLGFLTKGKKGFDLLELNALLSDSMTIITPNTEVLGKKQLHAEQSILYYLRNFTDFPEAPSATVNLGISKLCCKACHTVLEREKEKTVHRGTHGMKFPNVYDIDTEELYDGSPTMLGADLCPSDSDSECDFTDDEEDLDEVPTLSELSLEGIPTSPKVIMKDKQKFLMFKPCRQEIQDQIVEKQTISLVLGGKEG